MKIDWPLSGANGKRCRGFTVAEALVCVAILGVLFAAIGSALSSSLSTVGSARDTLRAAQIMTEKMDTIRLYAWDDLTNGAYLPPTFQVMYYPTNGLNAGTSRNQGTLYTGTMTITNAPITSEDYAGDVKMIIVTLTWHRGYITRRAQMSTLVSLYGMQNHSLY